MFCVTCTLAMQLHCISYMYIVYSSFCSWEILISTQLALTVLDSQIHSGL